MHSPRLAWVTFAGFFVALLLLLGLVVPPPHHFGGALSGTDRAELRQVGCYTLVYRGPDADLPVGVRLLPPRVPQPYNQAILYHRYSPTGPLLEDGYAGWRTTAGDSIDFAGAAWPFTRIGGQDSLLRGRAGWGRNQGLIEALLAPRWSVRARKVPCDSLKAAA